MSNVFDRLQQKLDLQKSDEGISPLHLMDLPPNLRKIMRLMLRECEITEAELRKKLTEKSDLSDLSPSELKIALDELSAQSWLIRRGEGERVTYQVNLRHRTGSKVVGGIWRKLDDRLSEENKPPHSADDNKT